MINFPKSLVIALSIAGFLALAGCGGGSTEAETDDQVDNDEITEDGEPDEQAILEALASGGPFTLVGGNAYVEAGSVGNQFQFDYISNTIVTNQPSAGCFLARSSDGEWTVIADFARDIPRNNDDFFSFFTPTGFAENKDLTDAGVQMGIFNFGAGSMPPGEEWSVVPGGKSFLTCQREALIGGVFDDDKFITCTVGWTGEMSENFSVERSGGTALFECVFTDDFSAKDFCELQGGCDDGNECTRDVCTNSGCEFVPRETNINSQLPEPVRNYFTSRASKCDFGGLEGVCVSGTCQPDPCAGACPGTRLFEDVATNSCKYEFCNVSTGACEIITADNLSVNACR